MQLALVWVLFVADVVDWLVEKLVILCGGRVSLFGSKVSASHFALWKYTTSLYTLKRFSVCFINVVKTYPGPQSLFITKDPF